MYSSILYIIKESTFERSRNDDKQYNTEIDSRTEVVELGWLLHAES